jgi:hypothetical protein
MVIKQIVKKINWNCIGKMKQFHFIGFQLTIHDWVSSSFRLCWPHDEILGVFCRVGESVLLSVFFSVFWVFFGKYISNFSSKLFLYFLFFIIYARNPADLINPLTTTKVPWFSGLQHSKWHKDDAKNAKFRTFLSSFSRLIICLIDPLKPLKQFIDRYRVQLWGCCVDSKLCEWFPHLSP